VWSRVAERTTAIRQIHVSRKGEFGVARLAAKRHGLDSFGAILPARELGNALLSRLNECNDLQRLAPAKLLAIANRGDAIEATLSTTQGECTIRTRLLVGADGTASFVRASLDIETENVDYMQTAFVCTVTPERAPDGVAFERFTATGPVALLPLGERRAGVVLTVPTDDAERVAAMDDGAFIDLLHERLGWRLGRLSKPGKRVSYPLKRVQSMRIVAPRAVLVGNAAQTLHPIGAQGFNLGLRDALTLAELLVDDRYRNDPGSDDLLADYSERRREDREGTAAMSDGLARCTASEMLPLKLLRSFGLMTLDRIAPLQSALVRRGMGFRGRTPRLALGDLR
jgi:2-octaprenyl-6-methoxyphenol hydroxylase